MVRVLPQALFALGCILFVFYNRVLWFELSPNEVSRKLYGTNPFPESVEIAKYIREHSPPGARIEVMGSEPQIYFYAHRHSSTGYINMYDLTQTHPYASQMQRDCTSGWTRPTSQWPCGQSTSGRRPVFPLGRYRLPLRVNPGRGSRTTFFGRYSRAGMCGATA